uniref:Uncharacterized protein n=1 Tax=Opuntia streptacantha TaxID=393608 RepID=A0A7C9CIU9_OPUST
MVSTQLSSEMVSWILFNPTQTQAHPFGLHHHSHKGKPPLTSYPYSDQGQTIAQNLTLMTLILYHPALLPLKLRETLTSSRACMVMELHLYSVWKWWVQGITVIF